MISARPRRRHLLAATTLAVTLAGVTGCSAGAASTRAAPQARSWTSVVTQAKGQTVNWYLWGGDDTLNAFLTGTLAGRLKRYGVSLNEVKVTDTVDAVNKVLAEKQAGRNHSGAVDLIWVNGENFATGKQAQLWRCGYPSSLPNTRYVDTANPAITHDFGVPVDGCESPWQQANSALVYDSSRLRQQDVASVSSLFAWTAKHPGRFTYPAPPDFTGSMAVRTFLYDSATDPAALATNPTDARYQQATSRLWQRLARHKPSLWRGGATYPSSQDAVEKLYASGEIDAFLTYGPGAIADKVAKGLYPKSTREAVLSVGNIANTSFVAIPYNAAHTAAAQVVANELLDPTVQLALYQAEGAYPALALSRLSPAQRQAFDVVNLGPSVLSLAQLTARSRPELPAAYVTRLEGDWKAHVQRR